MLNGASSIEIIHSVKIIEMLMWSILTWTQSFVVFVFSFQIAYQMLIIITAQLFPTLLHNFSPEIHKNAIIMIILQ